MNYGVGPVDCTVERTILLGSLSIEAAEGVVLGNLVVHSKPVAANSTAYWTIGVGTFNAGLYVEKKRFPFPGGFKGAPERLALDPELRVLRGDILAVRVTPTAPDASPLNGLCFSPEYRAPSARR